MIRNGSTYQRIVCEFVIGFAALALLAAAPIMAQTQKQLQGELGVDLNNFSYSSEVEGDTGGVQIYDVNRTLSTHFLELTLSGPVVNNNFANYALNGRVYGAYFRTNASGNDFDMYESPTLRNYSGQLTLFPARRYPLRLFHSKSKQYSLRYEPSSRNAVDLLLPELSVVRRYEADQTSSGAQFKYTINESTTLTTSAKTEKSENIRSYDFDEHRNIWILFSTLVEDPLKATDTAIITNTLTDADLIIVVDAVVQDTAPAGGDIVLAIDSGFHTVDIIPTRYYNQFSFRIEMRGDMVWRIIYNPPPVSDRRDQELKSVIADLTYDGKGRFSNDIHFEASSQNEAVQNLEASLTNLTNRARYEVSPNLALEAQTTINEITNDLVGVSTQTASALQNTTGLRWTPSRGPSGSITHSFSHNTSVTEAIGAKTDVSSDLHTVNGRVRVPTRWYGHELTVRGDLSHLRDNSQTGNDLYGTTVTNTFKFRLRDFELEPRQDFKYSITKNIEPPDPNGDADRTRKTTEIEPKFALAAKAPPSKTLGDVVFRLEYNYRRRYDEIGSDVKSRYFGDISLIRQFNKKVRLTLSTSRELETFGGSTPTAGPNPSQTSAAKPNEGQAMYRVDIQATPSKDLLVGLGITLISQQGSTIKKYSFLLNAHLPWLDIPIQSFVVKDVRDIEGLPRSQSTVNATTRVSHQFRQIIILFSHTLSQEQFITQKFTINEVRVDLHRNFSVF